MKKRVMTTLFVMVMAVSFTACGSAGTQESAGETQETSTENTEKESGELLYTVVNAGMGEVTDDTYDQYYKEGNAKDGVEAIIESGQYYVNGEPLPVEEEEFQVNEYTRLEKTADGWICPAYHDEDMSFTAVRLGLAQALSRMNGLSEELYCDDGSGYVTRIETTIYECTIADKILDNGNGTYSIDRGNYELATDEVGDQTDINDVVFEAENFDTTIQEGDVCLFWKDTTGWKIKRANSFVGHLTPGEVSEEENAEESYLFNGVEYGDGMLLSRAYMANQERGGMYVPSHLAFNLEDITVTFWTTDTGGAIGYTSGNQAKVSLERAIAYAEADKEKVTVSADGSDVASDAYWVTEEEMNTLEEGIETAQSVLDNEDSSNLDMDMAIYNLYLVTCASGEANPHQEATAPGFEYCMTLGKQ